MKTFGGLNEGYHDVDDNVFPHASNGFVKGACGILNRPLENDRNHDIKGHGAHIPPHLYFPMCTLVWRP